MKKFFDEDDILWEQKVSEETIIEQPIEPQFGCGFCWDKKKNRNKELFFLDNANNMRICLFCPYCGRKYDEVK